MGHPAARVGALIGVAVGVAALVAATSTSPVGSTKRGYDLAWERTFSGAIGESSPAPVTIDGTPAVVIGARNGKIYALNLKTGAEMPGWPVTTPGSLPVDSTASVNGSALYFGVGNAGHSVGGGYLALGTNGHRRWFTQVDKVPGDGVASGVSASLAFGRLQGVDAVTAGSLGQALEALNASTGKALPGFPFQSTDTEFATPAIANLRGSGKDFIIDGATQTGGEVYDSKVFPQGGHLWVLKQTGNAGSGEPDGGSACNFEPNEVVDSSPAVGGFLAGGATGIAFGTGTEFAGASDENKLFAMTPGCRIAWTASLDGGTASSPALVDALGNGGLQVAEAASTGIDSGTVYLLQGSDGKPIWTRKVTGGIIGSVTSANLGGGYQDILAPTTDGLYILNGKTGAVITTLAMRKMILQDSALVTDDADGRIGITIAGQTGAGVGEVRHYVISGTDGALADETGAWPEFHRDAHLTGSTLKPLT